MNFSFKDEFGEPRNIAPRLNYLTKIFEQIEDNLKNKRPVAIDFTGFEQLRLHIVPSIVVAIGKYKKIPYKVNF